MVGWLVAPEDFPSRDEALAIMAALDRQEAGTWAELEALSGVPNISTVAHRCFLVFGYRQLEGYKVVQALNAVSMRPRSTTPEPTQAETPLSPSPLPPADFTPGFTPRR